MVEIDARGPVVIQLVEDLAAGLQQVAPVHPPQERLRAQLVGKCPDLVRDVRGEDLPGPVSIPGITLVQNSIRRKSL